MDPDGGEVPPERDPGLATERTNIAWSRSALALVACAAAVLRRVPAMSRATGIALVLTVGAMVLGGSFLLRSRLGAEEDRSGIELTRLRLRNMAVMTSFTAALCFAVMLLTIG